MSISFKEYRRQCFVAIRELLCCKDKATVNWYIAKAKETTTEAELSRVMTAVREII